MDDSQARLTYNHARERVKSVIIYIYAFESFMGGILNI